MKDISIIIVNYNVKHFLSECLRSVFAGQNGLQLEVFVVDNNSVDKSCEMVRDQYPDVELIANQENLGFAAANNQAIKRSDAKYVLLLNPDTILEAGTLSQCFDYMEDHPECGALGVKMIDGSGKFLPESKRGFPTPFRSLMRLTGFSRLFPRSRLFNGYNLGYLDENKTHEVDVLSGAFMFIRQEAIENVGLLDEAFFMYGEDIDYSFRIQKAGYKIIYFPATTIIHFKGESTKKSSLKYHKVFYLAMAIFAKKHLGRKAINPFLWLINLSILVIGFFHYFKNKITKAALPVVELIGFFWTIQAVKYLWARFYYDNPLYYAEVQSVWIYSLYSLAWVAGLELSGSYQKPRHFIRYAGGILGGTVVILIIYALLDNSLRSSRAIILLSGLAVFITSIITRTFFHFLSNKNVNDIGSPQKFLVVGYEAEVERAKIILSSSKQNLEFSGAVYPEKTKPVPDYFVQSMDKLEEIVRIYKIDQVFFSAEDVDISEVMYWMTKLGKKVKTKIITRDVLSIIGSHDRNSQGDLYTMELNYSLSGNRQQTMKVLLDFSLNIFLLILSPFWMFTKKRKTIFKSIIFTTVRKRSWVGYLPEDPDIKALPEIPEGIFLPVIIEDIKSLNSNEIHRINFLYARDYSVLRDIELIFSQIRGFVF